MESHDESWRDPISDLVQNVVLGEKAGGNVATTEWYTLRWSLANDLGLVVVTVYQKIFQLHYVERLVDNIKRVVVHGAVHSEAMRPQRTYRRFPQKPPRHGLLGSLTCRVEFGQGALQHTGAAEEAVLRTAQPCHLPLPQRRRDTARGWHQDDQLGQPEGAEERLHPRPQDQARRPLRRRLRCRESHRRGVQKAQHRCSG